MLTEESSAQCSAPVNFQNPKNLAATSPLLQHHLTVKRDLSPANPYLYIAAKATGLIIEDISNLSSAFTATTIATSALGNLDVISVTQSGNYLYLALGDIFSASAQKSGMAIIDVSTPAVPVIKSVYSFTANSGAGYVEIDGNYAYLAAMQNGILVLDITNKSNIQFVSRFKPSVNFPVNNPSSSDQLKINARSMKVNNNIMYLCYDAGGVRIINITDKNNLKETGRYSNPLLNARPRAYNNLVLNDSLLYVAADYCGMEILNVKDTSNIYRIGWWNPWKCETTSNTWFNSPGHTNEIEYDPACKLVFMSAGRTDLIAVNVSNPALPDSCSQFGSKTDSAGTWGLGRYQDQIYLGYLSTWPLFIPFRSEWSGVKIVTYNNSCVATGIKEIQNGNLLEIYPNPATEEMNVVNPFNNAATELSLFDSEGKQILKKKIPAGKDPVKLSTVNYQKGIYFLRSTSGGRVYTSKVEISDIK
jgi:hypothetical protein